MCQAPSPTTAPVKALSHCCAFSPRPSSCSHSHIPTTPSNGHDENELKAVYKEHKVSSRRVSISSPDKNTAKYKAKKPLPHGCRVRRAGCCVNLQGQGVVNHPWSTKETIVFLGAMHAGGSPVSTHCGPRRRDRRRLVGGTCLERPLPPELSVDGGDGLAMYMESG